MADPSFQQAERPSLLLPVTLALLLLAAVGYLLFRFTPHHTADLAVTRVETWQTRTVYKNETIRVGQDKSQDDLYILATLHIDDRLKLPLFLKDLTGSLTTADGQLMITNATEKQELAPLFLTYPALKKLATPPLLRDTQIEPGHSAEGMVLLHFPGTRELWDHRQSATVTVAFYHQPPQTVTLPNPPQP